MLCRLSCLIKSMEANTRHAKLNLFSNILTSNKQQTSIQFYCKSPKESSDFNIVDVDVDKMMHEDREFASNYNYEPQPQNITSQGLNGNVVAPIDINPWIDEELEKHGTVDMEYVDKDKEVIHYPEPPAERSGYYEFEGIKIWLPQKMLTPAHYRYRLNEEEEQTLPDDIRICKFEKFKPTA